MKVGEIILEVKPSPFENPWTNVVFPLPKPPVSAKISPPTKSAAIFWPKSLVSWELSVINSISNK